MKNPPILIFDEATSALDTISERTNTEPLIELQANRTMILVAHRLSTLLTTDRIRMIADGAVAESSTYDELVAQGGAVRGTGSERRIGDSSADSHLRWIERIERNNAISRTENHFV